MLLLYSYQSLDVQYVLSMRIIINVVIYTISSREMHSIVDQLFHAVHSKKRTLYNHSVTDMLTLFQAIDLNSDGNISDGEFGEAMERMDIR